MKFRSLFVGSPNYYEAGRAALTLSPMLVILAMGKTSAAVPIGQAAFFFMMTPLAAKYRDRAFIGGVFMTLGLSFYMLGGTVAPYAWLSVPFIFITALVLSLLSGWRLGGSLVLSFMTVFAAGLNSGTPEKAAHNFTLFALTFLWATFVAMLPIWKARAQILNAPSDKDAHLAEQGFRLGLGSSIALAIAYALNFSKLGWAPSAVASIVRVDETESKARAKYRVIGTIGGALLALVSFAFFDTVNSLAIVAFVYAVLFGVFSDTESRRTPFFYTAVILILYSLGNLDASFVTTAQRVMYNLIGVMIGVTVALYSFPGLRRFIKKHKLQEVI